MIWLIVSGSLLSWHAFQIYARTTLAKNAYTRHRIVETYDALIKFSRDCGSFPLENQGLNALLVNSGSGQWNGPYISDGRLLEDAWHGHPAYCLRDGIPLVWSRGADGVTGTEDDVTVAYEEAIGRVR